MMDDEFKYVLDENGDRVLVGLTPGETLEFERLDTRLGAPQLTHLFQWKERFSLLAEKDGWSFSKGRS
jgi:hypothetical protein